MKTKTVVLDDTELMYTEVNNIMSNAAKNQHQQVYQKQK